MIWKFDPQNGISKRNRTLLLNSMHSPSKCGIPLSSFLYSLRYSSINWTYCHVFENVADSWWWKKITLVAVATVEMIKLKTYFVNQFQSIRHLYVYESCRHSHFLTSSPSGDQINNLSLNFKHGHQTKSLLQQQNNTYFIRHKTALACL